MGKKKTNNNFMMAMKFNILISLLLVCVGVSFGQEYPEDFVKLSNKYPDQSFVLLNDHQEVEISLNNNKIEIIHEYDEEKLYLKNAANYDPGETLTSSFYSKIFDIDAASYSYEGRYKKNRVKTFKEKDVIDNSFYDDLKEISFVYPKLGKASKTELSYTKQIKNPRFLSPIFFGDMYPIKNRKVSFTVDNDIALAFKRFNTEGVPLKLMVDRKNRSTTYTWHAVNVEAYKYESTSNPRKVLPHVIPYIKHFNVNGKKVKILGEIEDLYSWYSDNVSNLNKDPLDASLKALTLEITRDKSTEKEKVSALFNWTQKNIKYIDFEYGLGGFVPREANDVFNKKFGDCKDNTSLMLEMLKLIGAKAYITWIGTRDIPYNYSEIATPVVDNHMILTYIDDQNNIYFLDATGRYHSIGQPTSFIQGKEALIGIDSNNFRIEEVPIVSADKNYYHEENKLAIEDKKLIGSAQIDIGGYNKINLFRRLENYSTDKDLKQFYRNRFLRGSNKFLLQAYEEQNKFSYQNPFNLKLDYTINDYINQVGSELYLNLNLHQPLKDYQWLDDKSYEIELDYKESFKEHNILELPDNYTVDYLPAEVKTSNKFFDAQIEYKQEDHTLEYKHSFQTKFIKLNPELQKAFKKKIDQFIENYKEVIILKKQKS